jgi:isocitrate lyase
MTTLRPLDAPSEDPAGSPRRASVDAFEAEVAAVAAWMAQPRFEGIVRLHTARDVAEQRGTIATDHIVAREAAAAFHARLRELYEDGRAITTFGPYSPGQAVVQKRLGLEAIYLGGWATSAKGSIHEDPGPDLASYPLSAVPDEAATVVRALLTADRNQHFMRSRMTEAERRATPAADYRPFIIADADTGHGGDAHVRTLIRRFVEVGVPGYHIEDQRPGAKKCGHQAGKVLVAQHEQLKRLNAARLQLDIMGVPGLIVARTDAEAATLLDDRSDDRDLPFLLGATRHDVPSYRVGYLALLRLLHEAGIERARGHLLFAVPEEVHRATVAWLEQTGLRGAVEVAARNRAQTNDDALIGALDARFSERWQEAAGLMSHAEAAERGLGTIWDPEAPRPPEGYYRVRGGIEYAIARSLAAAPFADLLWMETKTADLADARRFAEAIHERFPRAMLAYNLSPSFNWDTTGMTDEEMRSFPEELGRLGFVFQFITYGGHQIDGLAAESFTTDLLRDGMLALARLQRRLRLVGSPYRTPQTLVGGERLDAALAAASGRTASTQAMGEESTQRQHLVATEPPPALLERWLAAAGIATGASGPSSVDLRPLSAWSDGVELRVTGGDGTVLAVIDATPVTDDTDRLVLDIGRIESGPTPGRIDLLVRAVAYLVHRYRADVVHRLGAGDADRALADALHAHGVYATAVAESDGVLVGVVDRVRVAALIAAGR